MMLLPKTSYLFLVISTQPPQALFKSLQSLTPNFIWQNKAPGYFFKNSSNRPAGQQAKVYFLKMAPN